MDDMLALLGSHQPCFLFNYIFLQRLPEDIRVALASEDINNPRQLAQKQTYYGWPNQESQIFLELVRHHLSVLSSQNSYQILKHRRIPTR